MPALAFDDIALIAALQAAGFIAGGFLALIFGRKPSHFVIKKLRLWGTGFFALGLACLSILAFGGVQGPLYGMFILLNLTIPAFGTYFFALPSLAFGFNVFRR